MAFNLLPEQKPMGILSPEADADTDLRTIAEMRDQFGQKSVQYERGLQEALEKYGGFDGLVQAAGFADDGAGNFRGQEGVTLSDGYSPSLEPGERAPITEERSGSLPRITIPQSSPATQTQGSTRTAQSTQPADFPTPGQKPTAGVNDPAGRLGTPGQGQGQNQGQGPAQPSASPSPPGSGSGNFFAPNLDTVLGGLAAGAARAGNLPHFGNALASAAAGGRAATQQQQQSQFNRRMAQAELQAQLAQAAQQGSSQFERMLDQAGFSEQQKQQLRRQYLVNQVTDSQRGVTVEQGPDGRFTIRTNAPQESGRVESQTATKNQVEEELVNAREQVARMEEIRNRYDSDFLQAPFRAGVKWDQLRSKFFGPGSLSDDERKTIERYSTFQSTALENLNKRIHELTGAQMSEFEAERLRGPLPDPGTGIIPRQDPVEFEANLDRAVEDSRAAIKRYQYMRQNGLLANYMENGQLQDSVARDYPLKFFNEDSDIKFNELDDMSLDELQKQRKSLVDAADKDKLSDKERRKRGLRLRAINQLIMEKQNGG